MIVDVGLHVPKAENYHSHGGLGDRPHGGFLVVTRTEGESRFSAKNDFRLERPQNVTKYTCVATSPHGGLHEG